MSLPADETPDTRVWSRLASRVAHRKPSVSIPTISVMHHSSTGMAEPSLATPKRAHRHRQDPTLLTTTPTKPLRRGPGGSRFLESICEQGNVPTGKRKAGQTPTTEQMSNERPPIDHDTTRRKEFDLDGKRIRKPSDTPNEDQSVVRRLFELKLLERSRSGNGESEDLQGPENDEQRRRRSSCKQS